MKYVWKSLLALSIACMITLSVYEYNMSSVQPVAKTQSLEVYSISNEIDYAACGLAISFGTLLLSAIGLYLDHRKKD